MAKNNFIGIRTDDILNNQIEAYASANHLTKVEAIRELLSSKCNNLSSELLQIKTATNISAVEATETKKHVAKIADIFVTKVPAIDGNIETLALKISGIEKDIKGISNILTHLLNKK